MNATMSRIRNQASFGAFYPAVPASPSPTVNGGSNVGGTSGVIATLPGVKAGIEATGQISLTVLGAAILAVVAFNIWTRGLQA